MGNKRPELVRVDPDEADRISVEQLASRMFQGIKKVLESTEPGEDGSVNYHACEQMLLPDPNNRKQFGPKVKAAWELLHDRGLVTWAGGGDPYQHCRITLRGRRSDWGSCETWTLAPSEAIADIEAEIGEHLDQIVRAYLEESIRLYQDGHPRSCVFMLGVVAERIMLLTKEWLLGLSLQSGSKLDKAEQMRPIIKCCQDSIRELKEAKLATQEIYDYNELIDQFATIYRTTRNEVGHPAAVATTVPIETAAVQLNAMSRQYLPAFFRAQQSYPRS